MQLDGTPLEILREYGSQRDSVRERETALAEVLADPRAQGRMRSISGLKQGVDSWQGKGGEQSKRDKQRHLDKLELLLSQLAVDDAALAASGGGASGGAAAAAAARVDIGHGRSVTVPVRRALRDVPKQEIAALPQYLLPARVRVTVCHTAEQIAAGVAEIQRAIAGGKCDLGADSAGLPIRAIGFDTETRPVFKKGETHQVALVQIYADQQVFLFRLCRRASHAGDRKTQPQEAAVPPPALLELLADPTVLKVMMMYCSARAAARAAARDDALPLFFKVGVGVSDDVKAMRTRAPAFTDNGSFCDLRDWLGPAFPSLGKLGLRNACAR